MDKFFSDVSKNQKPKAPGEPQQQQSQDAEPKKALPKGVVLGKDGKPCRSCTSFASWAAMTKSQNPSSSSSSSTTTTTPSLPTTPPPNCPPDVALLGRSTWTFLHTLTAAYPVSPTPVQKTQMTQFLSLFATLYPCWHCAEDFQTWMKEEGNRPRVGGRGELGTWMCEAHNAVNRKLGKGEFECAGWEERWRVGWRDGRCDG